MNRYNHHNLKLCKKCGVGFYDCLCASEKQKKGAMVFNLDEKKHAKNGQLLKAVPCRDKQKQPIKRR